MNRQNKAQAVQLANEAIAKKWEARRVNLEIVKREIARLSDPAIIILYPMASIMWANQRNCISYVAAALGIPGRHSTVEQKEFGIYPLTDERVRQMFEREGR